MPASLDNLARELRSAIIAGEHARAERLTNQYAEALRLHWISLAEPDRAASLLPQQARELLGWARDVSVMQRALASEHLVIIEKARVYRPGGEQATRPRAIEVRG